MIEACCDRYVGVWVDCEVAVQGKHLPTESPLDNALRTEHDGSISACVGEEEELPEVVVAGRYLNVIPQFKTFIDAIETAAIPQHQTFAGAPLWADRTPDRPVLEYTIKMGQHIEVCEEVHLPESQDAWSG